MRHGQGTIAGNRRFLEKRSIVGPSGTTEIVHVNVPIDAILCSIKTGAVDVWFGAFGKDVGSAPDLHFGQVNQPVWVPIPRGQYEFTLVASGFGTIVATFWFAEIDF